MTRDGRGRIPVPVLLAGVVLPSAQDLCFRRQSRTIFETDHPIQRVPDDLQSDKLFNFFSNTPE